jgi:ketosteroid isomerase-like protein
MNSTPLEDRVAALEQHVRTLEDQAALYRLICSWGLAADTADSARAASLWTEDGVLEVEGAPTNGPANIFAIIDSEGQKRLVDQGCAHVQGFPVVSVDGDRATATNYSWVYLHTENGYEVWRSTANNWEFRRGPDGWKVVRRSAHVIDGGPEARELLARAFSAGR